MCFSAEASFTLGAGLAVIGIAAIRNRTDSTELLLLAFPLIFAAQQATEGLLWLQLEAGRNGLWTRLLTQGYIFFAEVLWPALVAPALYLIERDARRKKIIGYMIPYGIAISIFLLGRMILWPFEARILGHSLHYESGFMVSGLSTNFYTVAVVVPLLLSSRSLLVVFGALLVFSFVITNIFYAHALISVWCFFAAFLSGLIYLYSQQTRRMHKAAPHRPAA